MTDGSRRPGLRALCWIVGAYFALLVAAVLTLLAARERADEEWTTVGRAWRSWFDAGPRQRRRIHDVVPAQAGDWWSALEGTFLWPGRVVDAEGSWIHGEREVRWTQRHRSWKVVVSQERRWFDVRTQVEFSGSRPPGALTEALKRAGAAVAVLP